MICLCSDSKCNKCHVTVDNENKITYPCAICTCWSYSSNEPDYDFDTMLYHIKYGNVHKDCEEAILKLQCQELPE